MTRNLVSNVLGVLAVGSVSAFALADKPQLSPSGDATYVDAVPGIVVFDDVVLPTGCDQFVYNSGDSTVLNSGRTVGAPSGGDRWSVYQPVVLANDTTVCGIDLDGWYVTGNPPTFDIVIYPEGNPGEPDLGNPLSGGPIQLGVSGVVNWKSVDITPVLLTGGTTYYVGTDSGTNNDHWSAIYSEPSLSGMNSYSVRNGDFSSKFNANPIALRLRGESGPCLDMVVSKLVAGQSAQWDIDGAKPGSTVAVVWGLRPGSTPVNGAFGYCATFGIAGVNQNHLVGTAKADATGHVTVLKGSIPASARGLRVLTQAAERDTCPDECMSDVDTQTVQ